MKAPGRRLFWTGYAATLALFGGLVTHTSPNPAVLGKYSVPHFLILILALALCLFYRRSANRRPATILMLILAVWLAGEIAGHRVYVKEMAGRARTEAEYDPFLQNRLNPADTNMHVNRLGFRGDELPPDSDRLVKVFMLGGSTVLDGRIAYAKSHPQLLQTMLHEHFTNVSITVQNAGSDWHTSLHSLIRYVTTVRPCKPDIVIVWHGINDLQRSFAPPAFSPPHATYRADYGHFYGPVARMAESYFQPDTFFFNSRFLSLIRTTLYSDFRERSSSKLMPADLDTTASLPAFKSYMETLVTMARNDGAIVIVANQPSLYSTNLTVEEERSLWMNKAFCRDGYRYADTASMARGMSLFNEASREVAQSLNARFVDLDQALPKTGEYYRDDCHYRWKGRQAVAKTLFDFIVAEDLVEKAHAGAQSFSPGQRPGLQANVVSPW